MKSEIKLTQLEQKLFTTLLYYRNQLNLSTVLRVAGGWVRDKLLKIPAKDIDIALNDMKGEEFVNMIKAYAQKEGGDISSFGVTKFNPEMSKHLETATAKIHGESIDFVNLRSQSYQEHSRIPIMRIGTPLQDALRRDFTINSLFYNINTGQIEDWTKYGLQDLQKGILRTPLAPLETFRDDPLRILRCFRFFSRFGFEIDSEILKSLAVQDLKNALKTKVSKERIGIQLSGLLKAPRVIAALDLVIKYGFWDCIFTIPNQVVVPAQINFSRSALITILHFDQVCSKEKWVTQSVLEDSNVFISKKQITYSSEELIMMVRLSALLLPLRHISASIGKTKETIIDYIVKSELKYSVKVAKFCSKTLQIFNQLQKLLLQPQISAVLLVKWLRLAEQKWEICILLYQGLVNAGQIHQVYPPLELRRRILQQKLENAYFQEGFIDGKFVMSCGKKGPIIATILQNATIWRILNPGVTKQEFIQHFTKNIQNFEIELK